MYLESNEPRLTGGWKGLRKMRDISDLKVGVFKVFVSMQSFERVGIIWNEMNRR